MRLIYIFIIIVNITYSQFTKSIRIDWKSNNTFANSTGKVVLPDFDIKYHNYDSNTKQLYYSEIFNNQYLDEKNFQVSNISSEIISSSNLGDISTKNLPQKLLVTIESSISRNETNSIIKFNTFYKNGNTIYRVNGIDITAFSKSNDNFNKKTINAVSNSVLASGTWKRFYVESSGVYKITKSFLQSIGIDTNTDPRNIRIYGNGGRMLPLSNSINYPQDIEENAIKFIGESDGVFNDEDYILFYAEGVDTWNKESLTNINIFSNKSYYYVTNSIGAGKRIGNIAEPIGNATLTFNTFDGYAHYERDLFNPGKIGRRWVGDLFDVETDRNYNFKLLNYKIDSNIDFEINLCTTSKNTTNFEISANNSPASIASISSSADAVLAQEFRKTLMIKSANDNVNVAIKYNKNGVPTSKGYLDYINIKYTADLKGNGNQFIIRNKEFETNVGIGQMDFSNASSINEVWDISDIYNVTAKVNNQNNFSLKTNLGSEKIFVALSYSNLYEPLKDKETSVSNQNIKGTIFKDANGNFADVDYIIVSPNYLIGEAERLANFHRNYSKLNTKVIGLDQIYQEFGSGKQDIAAIRNLIKYVYFNASVPEKRVRYVNLFGDASIDFKDRIQKNTNIVPIFHGLNPLLKLNTSYSDNFSLITTFCSDDFFGLMDPNEGTMTLSQDGIDIAVGRMLVNTIEDARAMVNKVIDYHDEKSFGRWRNTLTYYADDPDVFKPDDYLLQVDSNQLSDQVNISNSNFNTKKIWIDAYKQIIDAGGERYPQAKKDFLDAIENGTLISNYFGHGNEEFLAVEKLLDKNDVTSFKNKYKYTLFISVTCDFTRFDDPTRISGGELMYMNKEGGAVATLATTRQIFVSVGRELNKTIYPFLLTKFNGEYLTIAEALRRAKISINSENRRVVSYIGDPALKLAIPTSKIILTEVNNLPINDPNIQLTALSLATFKGKVVDENNNDISNYNGDLAIQIFDKFLDKKTLANDGANNSFKMDFKTLGESIFRGNTSIKNGGFEFSFVVPKDIQIPIGTGKISFYAKNDDKNALVDKSGSNFAIKIGGVNTNAGNDETPPTLRLFMNDTNFANGGITNSSPIFLAFLQDENGINTASGIGHDIVGVLDGDEINPIIMNEYYETINNTYKEGKVNYPFKNLKPGKHKIVFKAWDVYNNLITGEIEFVVIGQEELDLQNVLNYPNPFVNYTEFWFNHNKPFEPLDVQVQIFTITGKVVKTINQQVISDGFLSRKISWNGLDDFGDKIGKGTYVYKLTVRSSITGKKSEKTEKLVIL